MSFKHEGQNNYHTATESIRQPTVLYSFKISMNHCFMLYLSFSGPGTIRLLQSLHYWGLYYSWQVWGRDMLRTAPDLLPPSLGNSCPHKVIGKVLHPLCLWTLSLSSFFFSSLGRHGCWDSGNPLHKTVGEIWEQSGGLYQRGRKERKGRRKILLQASW